MAINLPPSPTLGQIVDHWQWDGSKWVPNPPRLERQLGGRLVGSGTLDAHPSHLDLGEGWSNLTFRPYRGNWIQIDGVTYEIPAAGVTVGTNNLYLDGVPNALSMSNVAQHAPYFVYLFNNNGTLTMDFSQTEHAQSTKPGNVGVEIKQGDDSRTLIGLAMFNETLRYLDNYNARYLRSWFNRQPLVMYKSSAASYFYFNSLTWSVSAPLIFLVWVNFRGEIVDCNFTGSVFTTQPVHAAGLGIEFATAVGGAINNYSVSQVDITVAPSQLFAMTCHATLWDAPANALNNIWLQGYSDTAAPMLGAKGILSAIIH